MRTNFVIAGLLASLVASSEEEIPVWSDDWEERAIQGMNFCDKDGGSTVSYKEFIKCMKQLGAEDIGSVEQQFTRYDLNGDNKIDSDEVHLVVKREYGPEPDWSDFETEFDTSYNWIDDNGDSKLSWYEFKSCWTPLYRDWDYRML